MIERREMSHNLNTLPQFKRGECLVAVIGDEDTVVGMLLAGFGQVASRKTPNFFVVDTSLHNTTAHTPAARARRRRWGSRSRKTPPASR